MSTNRIERVVDRITGIPALVGGAPISPTRPKRQDPIQWNLPGFCSGMRITTSFGDLPIEALRKRDPLRTQNGTLATVEWVDRIQLDEDFLVANPDALPIRIPAGCFGAGRPERDLLVSPQQVVNASPSPYAQDFRRAGDLTDRPGIERQPMPMVSYYLFHCATPQPVLAEGLCVRVSP